MRSSNSSSERSLGSEPTEHRRVVISPGVTAPYPKPSSAAATAIGKGNRRKDTRPEVALRSALHRRGLRFRKDYPIQTSERTIRADMTFTRVKLAVFVDGCFWHGCPEHQRIPKTNRDYWVPKLEANRQRDRRVDELLKSAGWQVMRVWEHEEPDSAAGRVTDRFHALHPATSSKTTGPA